MLARSDIAIAWRNIGRNKMRSVLTLLAVSFATTVLIFTTSLQLSSYATAIRASTALLSGHLQIQSAGYQNQPRLRSSIAGVGTIDSAISLLEGIQHYSLRAEAFILISSDERSYGAQLFGVQPDRETSLSSLPALVRSGRYLSAEDDAAVVLGKHLARNLRVGIGDEITFIAQAHDGSLAAGVLTVVGVFSSGTNELDRHILYVPLSYFQSAFAMPDQAHRVVLTVDSLSEVPGIESEVVDMIQALPRTDKSLEVLPWEELLPGLKQSIDLDFSTGWLFFLSLVLVVMFTIVNTFLMSVLERTREFGILLCLGMKPERISLLILLECSLLTVLGVSSGMLLGTLVVEYFGTVGFSIPGAEELNKTWNLPATIYPKISLQSLLQGPLIIVLTGIFASVYPALRIFALSPIEAVRRT